MLLPSLLNSTAFLAQNRLLGQLALTAMNREESEGAVRQSCTQPVHYQPLLFQQIAQVTKPIYPYSLQCRLIREMQFTIDE